MSKKSLFCILIFIFSFFIFLGLLYYVEVIDVRTDIKDVRFISGDKKIEIKWIPSKCKDVENVVLEVQGNREVKTYLLSKKDTYFDFTDGEYGDCFHFILYVCYKDGSMGKNYRADRIMLDMDKFPDLPLLDVSTDDFEDPEYDVVKKEKDIYLGETITNNDYKEATASYNIDGTKVEDISLKIKVRGNTSTVHRDKKSYKIKLDEKMNMLDLSGKGHKDRTWILLNSGENLNTYLGCKVSKFLNMNWSPKCRYVNVFVNGDYKGIYVLIESVEKAEDKIDITDNGYIFENDAYFWAEDKYFKIKNQEKNIGYTFVYPKDEDITADDINNMGTYMNFLEEKFIWGDDDIYDYIDEKSFAKWVLVRDVLGQYDVRGSNVYYYLYDFDNEDYTKFKLRMGPVWDFDSLYIKQSEWSDQHNDDQIFFAYLFKDEYFSDVYKKEWLQVKNTIEKEVSDYMDEILNDDAEAINDSRWLNSKRWRITNYKTIETEVEINKNWFGKRIEWLDEKIK